MHFQMSVYMHVCLCLLPSLNHACLGERSEAEDSGVREVRPALHHPGGEEEGDESEGDGRTGREGELYPEFDKEVRRPPGGEL